jgi:hypothetical protein
MIWITDAPGTDSGGVLGSYAPREATARSELGMVGASVSYRSKKVLKESRVPSYPRKVSIRSKVCSNFWYTKSERGINWQKKRTKMSREEIGRRMVPDGFQKTPLGIEI